MISYRKKLIDLAKIYRIKEVAFNQNNLTTTQIEVILLKKKIPIPSGKGLIAIKINNFKQPFINNFKKIDNFFRLTKKKY